MEKQYKEKALAAKEFLIKNDLLGVVIATNKSFGFVQDNFSINGIKALSTSSETGELLIEMSPETISEFPCIINMIGELANETDKLALKFREMRIEIEKAYEKIMVTKDYNAAPSLASAT